MRWVILHRSPCPAKCIEFSQETLLPVPAKLLHSSEILYFLIFSLFAFTSQMVRWNNTHLMYITQIRAKIRSWMYISNYMMIYRKGAKFIIILWAISLILVEYFTWVLRGTKMPWKRKHMIEERFLKLPDNVRSAVWGRRKVRERRHPLMSDSSLYTCLWNVHLKQTQLYEI